MVNITPKASRMATIEISGFIRNKYPSAFEHHPGVVSWTSGAGLASAARQAQ